MGDVYTNEETQPRIIPELQNRSVISIVLGDYHYGALTADGQLLTWGQYSHGALGLGVPSELPLGTPGGYSAESQLIQSHQSQWGPPEPPRVASPSLVHLTMGRTQVVEGSASLPLQQDGILARWSFAWRLATPLKIVDGIVDV